MLDSEYEALADQTIVLVPGMFSPAITMLPMARRFKAAGYRTAIFQNKYLSQTPAQNAERLLLLLREQQSDTVHLVGHSLGGIVIMHALNLNSQLSPSDRFTNGRVVLIASPVRGSDFAKRLHAKRFLRLILGRSAINGVLGGVPDHLDGREAGVISGSARGGLSALVYRPSGTNDGVVNDRETRIENAKDSICVPQSHASMLFSRGCAELAVQFFQHGHFLGPKTFSRS